MFTKLAAIACWVDCAPKHIQQLLIAGDICVECFFSLVVAPAIRANKTVRIRILISSKT